MAEKTFSITDKGYDIVLRLIARMSENNLTVEDISDEEKFLLATYMLNVDRLFNTLLGRSEK